MIGEWEGSVETAGLNHPYRLAKDGVHKESAEKKVCPELGELGGRGIFIIYKGMLNRYKLLVFRFVCSKNKMITLKKNVNVAQTDVNIYWRAIFMR